MPPKADIGLDLIKTSANDPKRTFGDELMTVITAHRFRAVAPTFPKLVLSFLK